MHKITAINTENNQTWSQHLHSLCACEKCNVIFTEQFQIKSNDIAADGQYLWTDCMCAAGNRSEIPLQQCDVNCDKAQRR